MSSKFALSFDTDWVSQEIIDETVKGLEERGLKSTFFCTDNRPVIKSDLVEVGLHPNLEGKSLAEIESELLRLKDLFAGEDIYGVRVHCLLSSSLINGIFHKVGLEYQSNYVLYLQQNIKPFKSLCNMREVPVFFMDYHLMEFEGRTPEYSTFREIFMDTPGFKTLCFHPVHIHMNTPSLDYYYEHRKDLKINTEVYGIRDFYYELLDDLTPENTYFMREAK